MQTEKDVFTQLEDSYNFEQFRNLAEKFGDQFFKTIGQLTDDEGVMLSAGNEELLNLLVASGLLSFEEKSEYFVRNHKMLSKLLHDLPLLSAKLS